MIDKAALRRMSQDERRELAGLLAELDTAATPAGPDPYRIDPILHRERRLALLVAAACCLILAGWIVVLAATLPHRFDAHHWARRLLRATVAGSGLDEALPRSRAERRAAGRARQPA